MKGQHFDRHFKTVQKYASTIAITTCYVTRLENSYLSPLVQPWEAVEQVLLLIGQKACLQLVVSSVPDQYGRFVTRALGNDKPVGCYNFRIDQEII